MLFEFLWKRNKAGVNVDLRVSSSPPSATSALASSYFQLVYSLTRMPGLVKDGTETRAVSRKALSIGITYKDAVQYSGRDAPPELEASHGDPEKVKQILTRKYATSCVYIFVKLILWQIFMGTRKKILSL